MSTTTILLHPTPLRPSKPTNPIPSSSFSSSTITCGPRDNRSPITRGRTLSSEAILAVQSLKRSSSSPTITTNTNNLISRLLLPDLTAALSELLRQDLPLLALRLLPLLRSDPSYRTPNLSLYADIIKSLHKNGESIDELVEELVEEIEGVGGIRGEDLRGPARLIKSLVGAGCNDGTVKVYRMMKKEGCVPNEYLFKFMVRGLRRLGDEEKAREVERDYHKWDVGGCWEEEEAAAALPV